jgi:hypothetical protein
MITAPKCYERHCIHYIGIIQPDGTEMTECCACEAFPEGIPEIIISGTNKHLTPLAGQGNTIVYKDAK